MSHPWLMCLLPDLSYGQEYPLSSTGCIAYPLEYPLSNSGGPPPLIEFQGSEVGNLHATKKGLHKGGAGGKGAVAVESAVESE